MGEEKSFFPQERPVVVSPAAFRAQCHHHGLGLALPDLLAGSERITGLVVVQADPDFSARQRRECGLE